MNHSRLAASKKDEDRRSAGSVTRAASTFCRGTRWVTFSTATETEPWEEVPDRGDHTGSCSVVGFRMLLNLSRLADASSQQSTPTPNSQFRSWVRLVASFDPSKKVRYPTPDVSFGLDSLIMDCKASMLVCPTVAASGCGVSS
jgi:hypothetical protein